MSLLKIARMGHPALRRVASEIDDPTGEAVRRLARDMVATMEDSRGVGLAAPQVHADCRLIVFVALPGRLAPGEVPPPAGVTVLANPGYEVLDATPAYGVEGCLSIPGLRGIVPRAQRIRYFGIGPNGEAVDRVAEGFHARVVQHEIDHLDGILYLDRMSDLRTLVFEGEMRHLSSLIDGEMETDPSSAQGLRP